jgi:uncharacterized protein YndB with AHSA1/START domain
MKTVTVQNTINRNVNKVWVLWTTPEHIKNWNFASPEWHCPKAEHDLKVGGKLNYQMAAKDGTMAFDYTATFTKLVPNELMEYKLDDGRKVTISFSGNGDATEVIETFEIEDENSIEMQRQGWQAILDNFKKYVESN